ncbi:MAG: hypothetical protein LAO78_01430 [Acidobacteriia bacterium]|nr:hypothetical protein [Terriglobia bacterium]
MPQIPPVIPSERLLQALSQCGNQLDAWLAQSQANARLFIEDPDAAMQAANPLLDLDLDDMLELEAVLSGLARKLDLPLQSRKRINDRRSPLHLHTF